MDKRLHDPDNCLPIEFTRYDQVDYFSGTVRSSGISYYFDYFDLIPTNLNNDALNFNLRLKPDIDYDITIVVNRTLCPTISYIIEDNECHITWSDQQPGLTYKLGDTILNSENYQINSVKMKAGQVESLSIVDGVHCASLTCIPDSGQLISYPVSNEGMDVSRPNGPDQKMVDAIRLEIIKQDKLSTWQIVLIVVVVLIVVILSVTVVFLAITRVEYTEKVS